MAEELTPALSEREWQRCVTIMRAGDDPLAYPILADADKALCWINGNRPNYDPGKVTRDDIELLVRLAIFGSELRTAPTDGESRLSPEMFERLRTLAVKLARLVPPEGANC